MITDLTGTIWRWNDSPMTYQFPRAFTFSISFSSVRGNDFRSMTIDAPSDVLKYDNMYIFSLHWIENDGKEISIIGGTDATNSMLIDLLENNATLLYPVSGVTVDLTTLSGWDNVSVGSHILTVKAEGAGYSDSAMSEGVEFTKAASGFSGNVLSSMQSFTNSNQTTYIKFDSPPSNADDYDYEAILDDQSLGTFSNQTVAYIWGVEFYYNDETHYLSLSDYTAPYMLTLTDNYDITLIYSLAVGGDPR